jgi:signal transduction histidine kinase
MDSLVHDLLLLAQTDAAADADGAQSNRASRVWTRIKDWTLGLFNSSKRRSHAGAQEDTGAYSPALGSMQASGSEPASAAFVDVSTLVNRNLLQFDAVFFERGIEVTSAITPGITIQGDQGQLTRLLQILLDNAAKYAGAPQSASGKPQVWVRLDPLQGRESHGAHGHRLAARLQVGNTGEPIPPEKLPHLFERFYRADTAHSNTVEGYGLGLSMARNIAQAHFGAITVESSAQSGIVFTVTL